MIKYKNTVFEGSAFYYGEMQKCSHVGQRIIMVIMVKYKNVLFEDSEYNYDGRQKCSLLGQGVLL